MKLVEVKEIPKRRAGHNLYDMLTEFMMSDSSIVRVDITEADYKSATVGYGCIRTAVRKYRYPIKVCMRKNEIYLKKISEES